MDFTWRRRIVTVVLAAMIAAVASPAALGREFVIDAKMHHLRKGTQQEWASMPAQAQGQALSVRFEAKANKTPFTLRLRHVDVKQSWYIWLNDKRLDRLPRDENDMVSMFALAPGALVDGTNRIEVKAATNVGDDILVGDIRIDTEPLEKVLNQCQLSVVVTQEAGGGAAAEPCRVTIVDANGSLIPLGAKSNDRLAVRPGVVYSADGRVTTGVPAGAYTIYAGRGFEYSIDSAQVTLSPGQKAARQLKIKREVPTEGYVAADTHVHTVTHSGHGDASMTERMITLAGEGIELPIATDHNVHVNYEEEAQRVNMRRYFTPVIGNEVTTRVGHFNVFPVEDGAAIPDWKLPQWPELFESIYATPGVKMVILNHGRDLHAAFRPFDQTRFLPLTGAFLDDREPRFNAMEVVNSAALQTDAMRLVEDWFALLNHGHRVTPIGSSDSHEVNTKIVGQGRTYVRVADDDPSQIDVDAAVKSFVDGRVVASMGLFVEMTINGEHGAGDVVNAKGSGVEVKVRVLGPSWVTADRVMLYVNGQKARELRFITPMDESGKAAVVKAEATWMLPALSHDAWIAAVALGPGVEKAYWPIAKTYQPTSPVWEPYVISVTGAAWIDADGDGKVMSPHEYAAALVQQHAQDMPALVAALGRHDHAVNLQAAGLLQRTGPAPSSGAVLAAMRDAKPVTREAFKLFNQTWAAWVRARHLERGRDR